MVEEPTLVLMGLIQGTVSREVAGTEALPPGLALLSYWMLWPASGEPLSP